MALFLHRAAILRAARPCAQVAQCPVRRAFSPGPSGVGRRLARIQGCPGVRRGQQDPGRNRRQPGKSGQQVAPYLSPSRMAREHRGLLVAIVIAMGIRTFFLQPFKIPTSSMQPTLFGVTVDPLYDPAFQMPGLFTRIYRFVVQGAIYHQVIAPQDGSVVSVGPRSISSASPTRKPSTSVTRTARSPPSPSSSHRIPTPTTPTPQKPSGRALDWPTIRISAKENPSSASSKPPAIICSWTA